MTDAPHNLKKYLFGKISRKLTCLFLIVGIVAPTMGIIYFYLISYSILPLEHNVFTEQNISCQQCGYKVDDDWIWIGTILAAGKRRKFCQQDVSEVWGPRQTGDRRKRQLSRFGVVLFAVSKFGPKGRCIRWRAYQKMAAGGYVHRGS